MLFASTTTTTTSTIHQRARGGSIVAVGLACAVAAVFWAPAIEAGRGWFPAPLDDVYIHFDFARSLGQGHPFEWVPGQGYSSGETSPLYAVVLSIGWMLGFRGQLLGVWAAILAVAGVASLLRSIRRLVSPCPAWLAWILALLPLSIGIVDWALFSGMEVAVFAAAIGRSLEALAKTRRETSMAGGGGARARVRGVTREALQWRLGLWGAALVLLRPEAVVIIAVFAIIAARGAERRSGLAALLRASVPGALATIAVLGLNHWATGDARSAGAQLKLLSSNPYMSDVDRARVFAENLITFWVKVGRGELAITPALVIAAPILAVLGLFSRRHRAIAGASLVSAIGWMLLVSWNGNSPHHNFRYYAPGLILLSIAAALGLATLATAGMASLGRNKKRASISIAAVLALFAIGIAIPKIPGQVRHFRSASANIRDQHIEVGKRIAQLPPGSRVLLGDAGAIPYVSLADGRGGRGGRGYVDALGLGGYHGVPFAHAAVHGEAATIELIERLDPSERPTHFALYPNWFNALTSRFGVEIDRVTIQNNIICGSPTKAIYRADWSTLDPKPKVRREGSASAHSSIVDELDVGDVIDEEEHAYIAPLPHGGWTTLDVLTDIAVAARRFDGGRTIPDGKSESFVVKHGATGLLTLRMRVDANARIIRVVRINNEPSQKDLVLEPTRDGAWRSGTLSLDSIREGERITFEAHDGAYRDYHVWIERNESVAR